MGDPPSFLFLSWAFSLREGLTTFNSEGTASLHICQHLTTFVHLGYHISVLRRRYNSILRRAMRKEIYSHSSIRYRVPGSLFSQHCTALLVGPHLPDHQKAGTTALTDSVSCGKGKHMQLSRGDPVCLGCCSAPVEGSERKKGSIQKT